MLTRLLLLAALVLALLIWWKHKQRGANPPPSDPAAGPAPRDPGRPEAMLRCVRCGVHLPASQGLPGRGGVFCSAEHRQQFEDDA